MPCIHRDHSPSSSQALFPLCILLILLLSLCCSSSIHSTKELCAGAGPVTPCFPKIIRPCNAAAQDRGHSKQSISQLSPLQGGLHVLRDAPSPSTPSSSMAAPHSPTLVWGALEASRNYQSMTPKVLPASLLPPILCYSLYESPNELHRTSPGGCYQKTNDL